MSKLYYMPINDTINPVMFNKFLAYISKERQKKIRHFYFDIDKKLSLYSELILRIIACESLSICNEMINIDKYEYGKPYIEKFPLFQYNISHTRNAVVLAVSDKPIGVDIEKVEKADVQIARRYFTTDEYEYIYEVQEKVNDRFFEIWTKKEAYIKYIGKGLNISMDSFSVICNSMKYDIHNLTKENYVISLCTDKSEEIINVIEIKELELENLVDILEK